MASVLRQADVVTCHTPHTKETHHMIDAAAVAQMKDGVIFVNTSRGKTQDEAALLAGLESGKIRAAGLDVFEEEPVSSDNRFLQLDNVIVSPHIAGVTARDHAGDGAPGHGRDAARDARRAAPRARQPPISGPGSAT